MQITVFLVIDILESTRDLHLFLLVYLDLFRHVCISIFSSAFSALWPKDGLHMVVTSSGTWAAQFNRDWTKPCKCGRRKNKLECFLKQKYQSNLQ